MKILYLSISYVPSRRASAVQVMNMCAAFAHHGHEVTLVTKSCPERLEQTSLSDFTYYGVPSDFSILKVERPAQKGGGIVFQVGVAKILHEQKSSTDLVFSRDLQAAALSARIGLPTVFEAHGLPSAKRSFEALIASPNFVRIVFISEALRQEYSTLGYDFSEDKVVVAHDAATLGENLHMSKDDPGVTVGYVGSLYRGRGVEILLDAAKRLPMFKYLVVGGNDNAVKELQRKGVPKNVHLAGFVSPGDLDRWYRKMDILLMPYSDKGVSTASGGDTSRWMSPLKMFEYMATGIPIISSDLPVLREVLTNGHDAVLVGARDIDAWVKAIDTLASSSKKRCILGDNARETLSREYTWNARASAVLAEHSRVSVAA